MDKIKTPLEQQLEKLSDKICIAVYIICGLLLISLNVHHFIFTDFDSSWSGILDTEIKFIMITVCICISGIPEGLSAACTIALSLSVKKMMKDNVLVKKMKASETLGAINIILSDKTGSLTQNKMTVVDTDEVCTQLMTLNGSINSTASLNGDKVIGNPTEGAILRWINKSTGYKYEDARKECEIRSQKPFNSTDKYMSTIIADPNSKPVRGELKDFILIKGAPEVISRMTNNESFLGMVEEQMKKGRRAISLASGPDMNNLHYDGSVFIEDPVREDVPDSIKKCISAGIDVVMMTGDSKLIGEEIARQAGFSRKLQGDNTRDIWAIEAKDFDNCAWGDPHCGYPNVIARCKPEDKLHILKEFQRLGYICGGFGDGTNDVNFLNQSNVGVSVGSGTSVAKEASDIVLLDDAFPSIVKGIKWGRSLYKNIQSFLSFQLTVNVALCLTALMGPLLGIDSPFSVIEILYINLVMDALGALALASEPAMDNVLDEKPRDNKEFIINKPMMRMILSTGIPLFFMMIFMILDTSKGWNIFSIGETGLFATFMTINWMNLFRARAFGKNIGVFSSLGRNKLFCMVALAILVMNILIVQFGGTIFGTEGLSMIQWITVFILSLSTISIASGINQIFKANDLVKLYKKNKLN